MGKFNKIMGLCKTLHESSKTVNIHGEDYNKTDIIDFARKYNHRVITLQDALDTVSRYDLFQEIKRLYIDKDDKYNY